MSDIHPAAASTTRASFDNSLVPMLMADDLRRYVDANRAACLMLRLPLEEVLLRRIDDLTPPERRAGMAAAWRSFLRDGNQSGTFELLMPDGPRMRVDFSATANIQPGRHLSIFFLAGEEGDRDSPDNVVDRDVVRLSDREREVLALIAMGEAGSAIATALGISQATVETHVRHCLTKLGAKNRAHAIALGLQNGEIDLSVAGPAARAGQEA